MPSSNTSATGGYLAPVDLTAPAEDLAFEDQLQAVVVGITDLPGAMVRPRWQPEMTNDDGTTTGIPKQPEAGVDWCAIGIVNIDQDANAALIHLEEDDGYDELQRHEVVTALASFYGNKCYANAARFRDGLSITQNRDVMRSQGMGLYDVGATVSLPALVNEQWVRRVDLSFRFRRIVIRTYPIQTLLAAGGTLYGDKPASNPPSQTFNVEP